MFETSCINYEKKIPYLGTSWTMTVDCMMGDISGSMLTLQREGTSFQGTINNLPDQRTYGLQTKSGTWHGLEV